MRAQLAEKQTMTEKEFCIAVGLCRTTIWKMRNAGKVPHCKVGKKIIYLPEHVTQFLKSQEICAGGNQ